MVFLCLPFVHKTEVEPEIKNLCKNFKCAGNATGKAQSLKEKMVEEQLRIAEEALADESNRSRAGFKSGPTPDPGADQPATMDLDSIKKKFSFLAEYTDEFISKNGLDTIIKLESTALRLKEAEKGRATEEKLALNRDELAATTIKVMAGVDNRWDQIHPARFLPGAACSAAQLWLLARDSMGNSPQTPVSSYDMAAIGLRGCVSSKGWVNIANPGGSGIRLAQFSMTGSTSSKPSSSSSTSKDEDNQIEGLAEFKLALRALRGAMSFALPWNWSVDAILGFMEQANYCQTELGGNEKQARVLTRFTDYILEENANRWRGKQAFVSTGEMKEAWSSFYSTLPSQAASKKSQFQPRNNNNQQQQTGQKQWNGSIPSGEGPVL